MAAPTWLERLTFYGFVLSAFISLILAWIEKKRQSSSWRLGFWIGTAALLAFLVIGIVLPSM
jgi:uncharacterized membrane protein